MAEEEAYDPRPDVAQETRRLWSVDGEDDSGPLELDRLIHERVRLGILSALAVNGSLSFNDLKEILKTSDGNLITHARRLEEAGYVQSDKSTGDAGSRTVYSLTTDGNREFSSYLDHMEALLRATRDGGEG